MTTHQKFGSPFPCGFARLNSQLWGMAMAACFLLWRSGTLGAQTHATLGIQQHAGLSITGKVGTVYSIEYTTNLTKPVAWRCLEFFRLPAAVHVWVDRSPAGAQPRFYRAVEDGPRDMIFIPPGTFRMGSPSNEVDRLQDEGPQTDVTISRGFYMAKYKVTQTDYQWVVGTYPSVFTGDFNRPVETVNWEDATNYCAILTRREHAARVIPPNCVYRLPTEAEWEYACRAWTSTRFSYGDDPGYTQLGKYAWYIANAAHTTHAVGQKLPNPWGLYEMHGGLWEWCLDWYGPYRGGAAVDPTGPPTGQYRVYRGGSWGCIPGKCRSAIREANPEGQTGYVGFRVVLSVGPP